MAICAWIVSIWLVSSRKFKSFFQAGAILCQSALQAHFGDYRVLYYNRGAIKDVVQAFLQLFRLARDVKVFQEVFWFYVVQEHVRRASSISMEGLLYALQDCLIASAQISCLALFQTGWFKNRQAQKTKLPDFVSIQERRLFGQNCRFCKELSLASKNMENLSP